MQVLLKKPSLQIKPFSQSAPGVWHFALRFGGAPAVKETAAAEMLTRKPAIESTSMQKTMNTMEAADCMMSVELGVGDGSSGVPKQASLAEGSLPM